MREKFEQKIESEEEKPEFLEKKVEEARVEEIWLDSKLEEKPYLVLDTPFSRLERHKVFKTQEGELYLEKEDRSNSQQEEMLNEFVGSNILQMLVNNYGLKDVLIPRIKAAQDRPGRYYSSFFENAHSFFERNIFTVFYMSAVWDKKIFRKELLPLVLAHLLNNDLDRNMSNYMLVVEENKPDKIAVLDFGEVVKGKDKRDRLSFFSNIIPPGTKKQDFEEPIKTIKKFLSEEYVDELLRKSFVSTDIASQKKKNLLANVKNLDGIVTACLKEVNKEWERKTEEYSIEGTKKNESVAAFRIDLQESFDWLAFFKKEHAKEWSAVSDIIEQYKAIRRKIYETDVLVRQAESYKDWLIICKQGEEIFGKHEEIVGLFYTKISKFNKQAQKEMRRYFEAVAYLSGEGFFPRDS